MEIIDNHTQTPNNGLPGRRLAVAWEDECCDPELVTDGRSTWKEPRKIENLGVVDNNPQMVRDK